MRIDKLIALNWGHIESREYPLAGLTLLTGGSGSGKTTTADAIQTVLTAARANVFAYNPGQDETTQRGRGGKQVRTLESYFLGAEEGGIYMRPQPRPSPPSSPPPRAWTRWAPAAGGAARPSWRACG
jgi:hypothetical protein